MLEARFIPLAEPPKRTSYKHSPFSAGWSDTLWLLERELRQLHARDVTISIAVSPSMIRRDGWPQDRAVAAHPKVVLDFNSKHGHLTYQVDTFRTWKDNLRAIAKGLEALRLVDRYEMSDDSAQYKGYAQLMPGSEFDDESARALIEEVTSISIDDDEHLAPTFKTAMRMTHPDQGGDPETFRQVLAAGQALGLL